MGIGPLGESKATRNWGFATLGMVLLTTTMALVTFIAAIIVPAPAEAAVNEEWPTLQYNHRGEDVRALQYLLTYHGYSTTADGVFGSGTKSKVQSFQSAHGLTADGIVGPSTWSALTPVVALGDSNYAVRAVQSLLKYKRGSGHYPWSSLTVDGIFGSGTRQAVKDFQSDVGITSDGVVGPVTWEHLLWHFDLMTSDSYICTGGSQPASESWGTASTIGALKRAGYYFRTQGGSSINLPFWDLSLVHGGYLYPHSTHQVGMDADIGIILSDGSACGSGRGTYWCENRYQDANGNWWCREDGQYSALYHQTYTRELVWDLKAGASFSGTQMVKKIFYNDPVIRNTFPGLMSKVVDHDHHLHIRYCTAGHSNASYRC